MFVSDEHHGKSLCQTKDMIDYSAALNTVTGARLLASARQDMVHITNHEFRRP